MNLLKYIELPHVGDYKGWRRKVMITLAYPQEVVRATYQANYIVFKNAQAWWRSA